MAEASVKGWREDEIEGRKVLDGERKVRERVRRGVGREGYFEIKV